MYTAGRGQGGFRAPVSALSDLQAVPDCSPSDRRYWILVRLKGEIWRCDPIRIGAMELVDRVRVLEVECTREIPSHGPAPRRDVAFDQKAAIKALLNETDEGSVIEGLGVPPAAFAPGRDDDHRYADAETVGSTGMRGVAGENFVDRRDRRQALGP